MIVLNIEDDVEDTILPRFRLAGGDKTKLFLVKGTRVKRENGIVERGVALDSDMHQMTTFARSVTRPRSGCARPNLELLGFAKYECGRRRSAHTDSGRCNGIVAITIGHFNRRERGTDPLHRIMGAAALSGVARAVYVVGPDPDCDDRHSHIMTVVRGCGSDPSALRYKTELIKNAAPDCPTNDIIRVVWCGKSHATAEDAVDPDSAEVKGQEVKAAELIKEFLREPPCCKPSKECEQFLVSQGFNIDNEGKPKLNLFRVRKRAFVQTRKFPGERFYSWHLQAELDQQQLI